VTNASRSFSLSLSLLNSFYTKIGTEPSLGRDVSVGYNVERSDRLIAATAYVYPLSNETFEDEVAHVARAHRSYSLVADRAVAVEQPGRVLACRLARVKYEEAFARQYGMVDSYILVCDDAPWRFMWRVTQRPTVAVDVSKTVVELACRTGTRK
jgi:hypothetical protein